MTGESLPVARNAEPVSLRETVPIRGGQTLLRQGEQPLQERVNPAEIANLVLAGSTVAAGRAVAVVYATGTQTEFGQVAHLTTEVKREPSTLEVQITRIVRIITAIAIGMGATVFLLSYFLIGLDITESFIFEIGIIVANVPEGLLPTVTLALALGVKRMARQNALVRRLSAVETLSATTVICTDKTGTLTKNEMTVRYLWLPPDLAADPAIFNSPIEITGAGYDPTSGKIDLPSDPTAIERSNLSEQFRTGWFIESTISASLVVLVVRTRQSIFTSKPGKYLFWATTATVVAALIIPFTPLAPLLGFQALPLRFLLVLGAIVALYVVAAEAVKHLFYQLVKF
jgi:magnesium-transporting ATPase (P-type)